MRFQTVCVLGLGYIGLPTASSFATHGLRVHGVDTDPLVLQELREGELRNRESGLQELAGRALTSGNFAISERPVAAEAFVIAVPTPVRRDKRADLQYVEAAAQAIVPHLRPGNLVMLESTCPPGTTVGTVGPILERSGLKAGTEFLLAYTPERALPGKLLQELVENPRVIGGIDRPSAEAGSELYRTFVKGEILLTDATTAEMVKLMENTYRDVNIAIANEFSRVAEQIGVDVWEAVRLANKHPRVNILRPGPGAGGHCIVVDPWFLVEAAPQLAPLIKQARAVNDGQPAHAAQLIETALGKLAGKRVGALGLAYKPGVNDLRESPAIEVVRLLVAGGARVRTFEPYAPDGGVAGAEPVGSLEEAVAGAEAVVLLVDHPEFIELDPLQLARAMPGRVAIDLRGRWDLPAWSAAGFTLKILGVGTANG
ncbi:MAG: nucleotide sugar dehydrogenase [Anaerolineales bacterium]